MFASPYGLDLPAYYEKILVGSDFKQFVTEWLEIWKDFETDLETLLPAPGGGVVALAWQRGKGRHSGLEVFMRWAMVMTVRNGKIIRIENYDDRAEALKAVGLEEETSG